MKAKVNIFFKDFFILQQ